MHRWKLYFWIFLLLTVVPSAWAGVEAGPGLEFVQEQTYVRDGQGQYLLTQEQQIVGTCAIRYVEGPWLGTVTAGWADWNVGGAWRGTHFDDTVLDPFFWGRRQYWELRGSYEVWNGISAGVGYSDRAFRHYRGDDLFVYMQTRIRTADVFVRYAFLRWLGLELSTTGTWSPYAYVEQYQNTGLSNPNYPAVQHFDAAGRGTQWRGALQASYRHPWGWGLDLVWDTAFAQFLNPGEIQECSQRYGRTALYLLLPF
jgi:hypothetical protein